MKEYTLSGNALKAIIINKNMPVFQTDTEYISLSDAKKEIGQYNGSMLFDFDRLFELQDLIGIFDNGKN
jgi:hypothetical protein